MKRIMTIAGLSIVLAGTLVGASSVQAEERTCRGAIGAVTVDNLRVPSGATCTLNGTTVKGTIKIETNARCRRPTSGSWATSRPKGIGR